MTREEAIQKAINIVIYFEAHFAKSKEAREDAANIIEALEQESCEDAVSRQAVKEQMIYYGFHAPDMTVTEFVEDCLPSVNPQKPKTGHWIRVDDTKMRCSNCDIIHLIAQYPRVGINYCPNCGAKMIEQQERSDKE